MLLILASCFYIGKPRNVACFVKKTMVERKTKLISYELSVGKMSNKFRISNVAVYLRCLFVRCIIRLTLVLRKMSLHYQFNAKQFFLMEDMML